MSHVAGSNPLPPALAAIQAISQAVNESQQPLTTSSETIALISSLSDEIKSNLTPDEALATSAGTDTFQKQLVTAYARSSTGVEDATSSNRPVADPKKVVHEAAQMYVKHSLDARKEIASYGRRIITTGCSIAMPSYSHIVDAMLRDAASAGVDFQVFLIKETHLNVAIQKKIEDLIDCLKQRELGVCHVEPASIVQLIRDSPPRLGHTTQSFPAAQIIVLTGAAALTASGGILALPNTQISCSVAKAYNRPVFVAAETCKCVKELGVAPLLQKIKGHSGNQRPGTQMDFVPAEFISSFITEFGPQNPAAVADEALKKWS